MKLVIIVFLCGLSLLHTCMSLYFHLLVYIDILYTSKNMELYMKTG